MFDTKLYTIMPKGHNQEGSGNDKNPQGKHTPGQDEHKKGKARQKENSKKGGRNEKTEQSGGKKGSNAV